MTQRQPTRRGSRLLALVLLGSTGSLWAQDYRYEIGISVGTAYYVGDVGHGGAFGRQAPSVGITFRQPLGLRWALTSQLGYRRLQGGLPPTSRAYPTIGEQAFSRGLLDLTFGGEFHFFPYSDEYRYLGTRSWTPFLGAGLGLALGKSSPGLLLSPSVGLTLGVKYRLSRRLDLIGSWSHLRTFTDRLEVTSPGTAWMADPLGLGARDLKGHDSYGYWSVGVSWRLGRQRGTICD